MSRADKGAALVTGAGKRIGRAIAERLSQAGYAVAIHYRESGAEANQLAAAFRAEGRKAITLAADLSDAAATSSLVARAAAELGPVTLAVNNASVFPPDDAATFKPDMFDAVMATNLRAPLLIAQALAANLPEGVTGSVINLIDQRVWRLTPDYFSYTLSKSALWTATRTMAQAFGPRLRVNAIGPGPALPNVWEGDEAIEREVRQTPLRRRPTLDEIADAVLFLAEAPSVTGQMIAVDSGQHLI